MLIAYFLSNISAKYYENLKMLSRVIAKNIGDVFLRHSVVYIWFTLLSCLLFLSSETIPTNSLHSSVLKTLKYL